MPRPLNIALIGQEFMGRAHSNGWGQAGRFFDLPRSIVLHTVCARNASKLTGFADNWGWENHSTKWRDLARNDAIDVVDVATPNNVHAEQSIAMLEAGKHVACEKPLSGTLDEARAMKKAATAAFKKSGAKTFVWFNYRRCPAVAYARELVKKNRIGRIYHVRASYLQSWGGPKTPLLWRFKKRHAGSGAHGDLNAHIVDMARFITGEEITEIHGAVSRTFIKERTRLDGKGKGRSDVDDAVLFLASLKGGATASFEATRLATGHQNANCIEINGEKGSLRFEFENMNVLQFMDASDGPAEGGWRRIMCTSADNHPYAASWWPDAHVLGYEHGFANMAADICRVLGKRRPETILPDFADAYETQRVLEAAMVSAANRCAVRLSEVR